jgi:hypothetical protein
MLRYSALTHGPAEAVRSTTNGSRASLGDKVRAARQLRRECKADDGRLAGISYCFGSRLARPVGFGPLAAAGPGRILGQWLSALPI